MELGSRTGDPGRKGAPRDVLVVVLDQDAVVSRQDRQVGHRARPVLVVHTADVGLGRTLNGQGQTTCTEVGSNLSFGLFSTLAVGGKPRSERIVYRRDEPSPASLVLTVNTAGLLTVPWMRPGP